MNPDANGDYVGYYGSYNIKDKPKHGVHLMILDDYILNSVTKEKDRFKCEMKEHLISFQKSAKEISEKANSDIKLLRQLINDNHKFMMKLIKLNDLKKPVVETKKNDKPKPDKNNMDDDESDDESILSEKPDF